MDQFNFDISLQLSKQFYPILTNQNQITTNPSTYNFSMKLSKAMLIQFNNLWNKKNKINIGSIYLIPRSITLHSQAVQLADFQIIKQKRQSCLQIKFGKDCTGQSDKNNDIMNSFYSFNPEVTINDEMFNLTIKQNNLQFSANIIRKAKFVKNKELENTILSKEYNEGMLSMDQIGRIMIQASFSKFPVIGIWQKNNNEINHLSTYHKLYNFLYSKHYKKCRFTYQNQSYFYYAKFKTQEQELPQLYLISWSINPQIHYVYQYKMLNLINSCQQYVDLPYLQCFGQQEASCLQFTLRNQSNQNLLTSIDFCSPIKQFTNNDLEDHLATSQTRDSPKFHKTTSSNYQNEEKEKLLLTINQQNDQILILKDEIKRLKHQLQIVSLKKEYETGSKNYLVRSPDYQAHLSTAKIKPKLSESDLKEDLTLISQNLQKFDSFGESSIQGCSSVKKTQHLCQTGNTGDYGEPWENFQFID